MPLVRLIAEGVGPFDKLDLDFSDGNGKPHLGPHILAGVNGSGKSTVLRTIAWLMDRGRQFGFHYDDWSQALKGHALSRALAFVRPDGAAPFLSACAATIDRGDLDPWVQNHLEKSGFPIKSGHHSSTFRTQTGDWLRLDPSGQAERPAPLFNIAAYSPSLALKRLRGPRPANALSAPNLNCLSFDRTVDSETVQSWLLNLDYGRAKARERSQSGEQ